MSALDPASDRRLRASLTRLASDHDGEILAAANAVGRILGNAGLGFGDLGVVKALPPPRPERTRSQTRRSPKPAEAMREHQRIAWGLSRSGFVWNEWEQGFLASIAAWARPASAKQSEQLKSLSQKVAAWRATKTGGDDADF